MSRWPHWLYAEVITEAVTLEVISQGRVVRRNFAGSSAALQRALL